MNLRLRIALSLGVAVLGPFGVAVAADYDPPIYVEQADEYVPVEVGSGWYLRGDVSYNAARSYKNTSLSVTEPELTEPFIDLGPLSPMQNVAYSEKDQPVHGSIGIGYHFTDYLRGDVNIGLFGDNEYQFSGVIPNDITPNTGCAANLTVTETPIDINGNTTGAPVVTGGPTATTMPCLASGSIENVARNGMANGYIDLGTYVGFTPYIGGGVGLLYSKSKVSAAASCQSIQESTDEPGTRTTDTYLCQGQDDLNDPATVVASTDYTKTSYNLMYALNAGVSYQVSKNVSLDLGYQYMAAPSARYYSIGSEGIESHKGIDYHQVKVGLRYDLW